MTQNTYTRIQFQNAVTERDRRAQDVADAHELVTPFTVVPGTEIYDVTIRQSQFDPAEVIVTLGLYGGTIEQRTMPNRAYTFDLAREYAKHAHIKMVAIN